MVDLVGFRLCPTEDEMVGRLLYYKLMQRALRANDFINEINIYNFDPWELRLQSKIKSRDPLWYFYTPVSGDRQNRSTSSGFWKITGEAKAVHDRWGFWSGNIRGEIGFKRVLRFHIGKTPNKGNGDWIIHEFHNTVVPEHLRTHVMCRVEYKGDDISFVSDNPMEFSPDFVHHLMNSTASVVNLPVQENWGSMCVSENQNQHLNTQEQGSSLVSINGNEMQMGLNSLVGEESMVDDAMISDENKKEEETQMFSSSCIEDIGSMWNESMVLGNSSSFGESKFYLNELCFNSPLNSPEFTYEASPYEG